MRIKVLFTGGTIGSATGPGAVISTAGPAAGRLLLANFFERAGDEFKGVEFDTAEPYTCLSEDLTVAHWNKLLAALREIDFAAYDGVIITHGTDTLAYTANLLSAALGGVGIPVMLLGSNYVLSDERADGNLNFLTAVRMIKAGETPGVFAISQGNVFLGSRVQQCRPFTDEFSSVNGVNFAVGIENNITYINHPQNPTPEMLRARTNGAPPILQTLGELRANVLVYQPYVGLEYGDLPQDRDLKAVLHGLYHSSTACVGSGAPEKSSILTLSQKCEERGIALFIAPFKADMLADGARYETTDILMNRGVGFCCDMSFEMAYAKLLCACALTNAGDEMQKFMDTPLFFEQLA